MLDTILVIAGIVLSIMALNISIKALKLTRNQARELANIQKSGRKQLIELEDQQKNLFRIYSSLSTRYLGEFPYYYDEIVTIVKGAKKSIQIVTDIPAYGHFSRYESWLDYSGILKRKIVEDGITVELMCLNKQHRSEQLERQFLGDRGWNNWIETREGKRLLNEFGKRWELPDVGEFKTKEFLKKFQDALSKVDDHALEYDFSQANLLKELNVRVPLHFWIIDGRDAIFEFPSFVDGYSAHGFRTLDQSIIKSLQNTFAEYQ